MPDARRCPVERLLAEAVGVLQVEPVDVCSPDDGEVGRAGATPPEPELLGDARLAWQALHFDQHARPANQRPGTSAATGRMVLGLRVHVGPGPHAHRPVLRVLLTVLLGWRP